MHSFSLFIGQNTNQVMSKAGCLLGFGQRHHRSFINKGNGEDKLGIITFILYISAK